MSCVLILKSILQFSVCTSSSGQACRKIKIINCNQLSLSREKEEKKNLTGWYNFTEHPQLTVLSSDNSRVLGPKDIELITMSSDSAAAMWAMTQRSTYDWVTTTSFCHTTRSGSGLEINPLPQTKQGWICFRPTHSFLVFLLLLFFLAVYSPKALEKLCTHCEHALHKCAVVRWCGFRMERNCAFNFQQINKIKGNFMKKKKACRYCCGIFFFLLFLSIKFASVCTSIKDKMTSLQSKTFKSIFEIQLKRHSICAKGLPLTQVNDVGGLVNTKITLLETATNRALKIHAFKKLMGPSKMLSPKTASFELPIFTNTLVNKYLLTRNRHLRVSLLCARSGVAPRVAPQRQKEKKKTWGATH